MGRQRREGDTYSKHADKQPERRSRYEMDKKRYEVRDGQEREVRDGQEKGKYG